MLKKCKNNINVELVFMVVCSCLALGHSAVAATTANDKDDAAVTAAYANAGLGKIIYDQRQTGKYNIHVSIKDVAIIEVAQNDLQDDTNANDEYYYDDGDLTVKPIKFATTKTTTMLPGSTATEMEQATLTTPLLTTLLQQFTASTAHDLPLNYTLGVQKQQQQQQPSESPTTMAATLLPERSSSSSSNNSTALPFNPMLRARTKEMPIHEQTLAANATFGSNSRIYKVKVQRAAPAVQSRKQHIARSASSSYAILRKLFGTLLSLPFAYKPLNQQAAP